MIHHLRRVGWGLFQLLSIAGAAPVVLSNPSGEENSGIDRAAVPDPGFPGLR